MASLGLWGALEGAGEGLIERAQQISEQKASQKKSRMDELREQRLQKTRFEDQQTIAGTKATALKQSQDLDRAQKAAAELGKISTTQRGQDIRADTAVDKLAEETGKIEAKGREWKVEFRKVESTTGVYDKIMLKRGDQVLEKEGNYLWSAGMTGQDADLKEMLIETGALGRLVKIMDKNMRNKSVEEKKAYVNKHFEKYGFIPAKYMHIMDEEIEQKAKTAGVDLTQAIKGDNSAKANDNADTSNEREELLSKIKIIRRRLSSGHYTSDRTRQQAEQQRKDLLIQVSRLRVERG